MSSKFRHYYNMDNLSNDLVSESSDKYQLDCPFCEQHGEPNRKPTLYIYKESETGYCFRCNSFIYTKKDKNFNSEYSIDRDFNRTMNELNKENNIEYDTINLDGLGLYEDDDELVNYIKNERHICYHDVLIKLNCKSFIKKINDNFKIKGILFPFYINDNIVSYQIRYINVEKKYRYYTKPGTKIPFRINDSFEDTKITICEGVFDALAYNCMNFPSPVAILANNINESVGKILLNYTKLDTIFIGLDDLDLSYNVAKQLNELFPLVNKYIIKLPNGLDPDETFIEESKIGTSNISLIDYKSIDEFKFNNSISKLLD